MLATTGKVWEEKIMDERADDVDRVKVVVGKCIECQNSHSKMPGMTLCAVCQDLVLLCPSCRMQLNKYHCKQHGS